MLSLVVLHFVRIALIVVIAYVAQNIGTRMIIRGIRTALAQKGLVQDKQREHTLAHVCSATATVLIWVLALFAILSDLGINIAPLIATAGIAGIAFGFGGQYLVRDIITGLIMLIENQYRVGDWVCFDSTFGRVEGITLRKTTLRDLDGTLHHIPHGDIKRVSNMCADFALLNIKVGVSYSANIDHVERIINDTGISLMADMAWMPLMKRPPAFVRVHEFADSAVIVYIDGETAPGKQWDVAGEFLKRLKAAFDAHGIEIPYPQVVMHAAPSATRRRSAAKES